jgi:DNA-binding winged helix-turn-helix (wHTH) protein/tetratricopeptide (TPR) repeat protein
VDEAFQQSFGRIAVEPARRRLLIDDEPAKIGARAFDLLMALIERRDRVVSKDELLDLVWPNVTVEEGNLQVQIATLRRLLGADAIATVPGRGYQFVGAAKSGRTAGERRGTHGGWRRSRVGARLARQGSAMVGRRRGRPGRARHCRRVGSAVARPAAVRQAEPGRYALRERQRGFNFRAARQRRHDRYRHRLLTPSRYRRNRRFGDRLLDRPDLDARKVASDLKVQYVLTGAVQRDSDLVQVSAQVTDGATGESIWSNRWQGRAGGDLLGLQADVADGVASTLGSRNFFVMRGIDAAKAKAPEARTAYDLYALGYADYLKGTVDGFADAKRDFDAAIAKNPRLRFIYVQRGWAAVLYAMVSGGDYVAALPEMERYIRKAIEVDPLDAEAHVALAGSRAMMGDFAQSEAEAERGLRLNPSSADIMMKVALSLAYLGQPERGAELCDRAFHLNTMPVVWYAIHCGESYYMVGRYADAVDMVRRTHAWIPPNPYWMSLQLAAEAELANGSAAATLAEFKRRFPGVTAEDLGYATTWRRPEDRDKLVASMVKAGGPVCVPPDRVGALPQPMHLALCDAERAKEAAR